MADWKTTLKDVWHFVWYEDSWASWFVNLGLAFVIIKYIVYPLLGFVLGTSLPIVAVVSGSMDHGGDFDTWWNSMIGKDLTADKVVTQANFYSNYGIAKNTFMSYSFKNGFNKGDIMILYSAKTVNIGDVIVFPVEGRLDPIIHRVISMDEKSYTTKGDANPGSASFEQNIPKDSVVGKALIRVPLLGWVKIGFVWLVSSTVKFIGGIL